MTSEAAIHKRNLESSILFMQQEHANTLKALHDEIERLQKKCTDLTFQLTMHGLNIDDEGTSDTKLKGLQDELEGKRKREKDLMEEVKSNENRMKVLENEVRAQRKKYLEEQRSHKELVNSLKADLEAKSNNIAYLTTELHRIKTKQKMDFDDGAGVIIRKSHADIVPNPPRETLSSKVRRNPNIRRGAPVVSSFDDLPARSLRMNSSKSSSTLSSTRSDSPDITPFIHRSAVEPKIEAKPAPPVLPPITASSMKDTKSLIVHQILPSQHRLARRKPGSPQGLTTLAVEPVPRTDASWPHAHESRSSEYN